MEVVAVTTSATEVAALVETAGVDVLVTDVAPDPSAVDGSVGPRHNGPAHVRVVVLSEVEDPDVVVEALRKGAAGYLTKEATVDELLAAVRGSVRGETSVSPRLLTPVLTKLLHGAEEPTVWQRQVESLTRREREILECMVAGLGPVAIARELVISANTVRSHSQRLRKKLGAHSTLEAVGTALRAGVRPRSDA